MKLNRFLKRQLPGFRQHSQRGAVGGRSTLLMHPGVYPLRTFKGMMNRHRLILMLVGSVVVKRDGRTYLAEAGDGLLVPAGEGELTFLFCPRGQDVRAEILEFDQRTLAPKFRNSPGWESLALAVDDPSMGAIPLPGLERSTSAVLNSQRPARLGFSIIMGELFHQFRRGLPQFLRDHFYRQRWTLFALLESKVLLPDGIARLAAEYRGGAKQLRKDCLVYLGAKPESIIARRRCELATAWLRCGHSIGAVAKALGYSSQWEFETAYSGRMRRRCADVQKMPPLASLELEELLAVLRPSWWPARGPSRVRIPQEECALGISADEWARIRRECAAAEPRKDAGAGDAAGTNGYEAGGVESTNYDPQTADDLAARRAKAAEELREKAADFFAMKSTGAEIIVPIFGEREVEEALAA